jgi:Flp pilus assembly protein TadG
MRSKRSGSAAIEFTLVGIPLVFALISIVEMSRGMWLYFSQTNAVREAVRYVVVRGSDCLVNSNTCSVTVEDVANTLLTAGIGLVSSDWNVTLISSSGLNNVSCRPLSSCLSNTTTWPPAADASVGSNVAISASYPFTSALAMFWPGAKAVTFGSYNLPAYSRQGIQF